MTDRPRGRDAWTLDGDHLQDLRRRAAAGALRRGEPHRAMAEAEELLQQHPEDAGALRTVVDAALALEEGATALAALDALLPLIPDGDARHAELVEARGWARFLDLDLTGAAADLAAPAPPETPDGPWRRLRLELQRGGPAEALLSGGPADDEAWLDLIDGAIEELPDLLQEFYTGVPVELLSHPSDDDLRVQEPPVSPLVYALYVGAPPESSEELAMPEAVRLFQVNLLRGSPDADALKQRIAEGLRDEALAWMDMDLSDLE